MMKRISTRPAGIALLMVLAVLALMSVLAVTFVRLSQMERGISRNYVDRTTALIVAESGIDHAFARILAFRGGVIRPDEFADMRFVPDDADPENLAIARHVSFQAGGAPAPVSGTVSGRYRTDGDYFVLRVSDESGKINLNDSNGLWNPDTDPLYDDPATDSDLLNATGRLREVVSELGRALFNNDPDKGGNIANALFDKDPVFFRSRPNRPGDRFSTMEEVRDALTLGYPDFGIPPALSLEEFERFEREVTLASWQDPNVLRPTFQLHLGKGFPHAQPRNVFNVYRYDEMQTRYFELEPRSPVNVNTASKEVLQALIAPVRGWYLYEGAPCSLMDGSLGPWIKALRVSSFSLEDTVMPNGYDPQNLFASWVGLPATSQPASPSGDWTFGNATRYGEARLTKPLRHRDADFPALLAERIHDRAQGLDMNNDGDFSDAGERLPQPFLTWDEFTRYIYSMVDTSVQIVETLPEDDTEIADTGVREQNYEAILTQEQEALRLPYRLTADSAFPYAENDASRVIEGFDRYQADALLANFNPNSMLNDFNPDFSVFRHVDKSQLTQYTTELSFYPTGTFRISSLGLVTREEGIVAQANLEAVATVFVPFRQTSQAQFMGQADNGGYDPADPGTLYNLFQENYGAEATSGADLLGKTGDAGGRLAPGGRWGPSVTSYPEPLRNIPSVSIQDNPYFQDRWKTMMFSRYEGSLQLSTIQRDVEGWAAVTGETPQFIASMGYRYLPSDESGDVWREKSLAVGGMLPLRLGNTPDEGVIEIRHVRVITEEPFVSMSALNGTYNGSVSSDELDTMSVPGGRGVMLTWDDDYTRSTPDLSGGDPFLYWGTWGYENYMKNEYRPEQVLAGYNWKHDVPWNVTPHWNSQWLDNYFNMDERLIMAPQSLFVCQPVLHPEVAPNLTGDDFGMTEDEWEDLMDSIGAGDQRQPLRMGWNLPSDMPLTPDAVDDEGLPVELMQGNLYPDGAFSEAGRLLSYRATNLGTKGGDEGTFCFWVKPNWDTGYSNRVRQFFSVGHLGPAYTHPLDLLYFPAGTRPDGSGPVSSSNALGISPGGRDLWPLPSNSFMFGWYGNRYGKWGGNTLENKVWIYESGFAKHSKPANRYSPSYSDASQATPGWYGHQWNLLGMTYRNTHTKIAGASIVELSINGQHQQNAFDNLYTTNSNPYPTLSTQSPTGNFGWRWPEVDMMWEEADYYHGVYDPEPEPRYAHMGQSYMRFGWCADNGGPVADSTYDEIACWPTPLVGDLQLSSFTSMWNAGRYACAIVDGTTAPGADSTVVGLYTSPKLNVHSLLRGASLPLRATDSLILMSAAWTGYWPRYNDRAGGIRGVDLHAGVDPSSLPEADPVTGDVDPFSIDVFSAASQRWVYHEMAPPNSIRPTTAFGSSIGMGPHGYGVSDNFQYRVYFHLVPDQALLESPVFDEITFFFALKRPIIHAWRTK